MHDSLVPSIERISPEEEPIVLPHLVHLYRCRRQWGLGWLSAALERRGCAAVLERHLSGRGPRHLCASRSHMTKVGWSARSSLRWL